MDDQNSAPVAQPDLELQLDDPIGDYLNRVTAPRMPSMPTVEGAMRSGLHPKEYLDRMRRAQSTDISNDYEE